MVSKNQLKLITGLHQKKYRQSSRLFIAEGAKVIGELLQSDFKLRNLYVSENLFDDITDDLKMHVSESDLRKMSALSAPNNCLAVFEMAVEKPISRSGIILVLDDVRDPGNLGTILRLCDWFGISDLVCSVGTVDIYNPKVIQATMGSIARVNTNYVDLADFLSQTSLPVIGTFMDGANIYMQHLPQEGIIIMGNEANGISENIEKLVSHRLAIPRFGELQQTESLNVATATAIVLSEFRRGNFR